jgi:hypothetical protein
MFMLEALQANVMPESVKKQKCVSVIGCALTFVATCVCAAPNQHGNDAKSVLQAALGGTVDAGRAAATPRPRSFANTDEWLALRNALLHGERSVAFKNFVTAHAPSHQDRVLDTLQPRGKPLDNQARVLWELATKQSAERATRIAQGMAFAALVTQDANYIASAKQRMLALADLDPKGATGVSQEDLAARRVAWTLALGLDWLYSHWTAAERSRLVAAIAPRMEDFALRWVRGTQPLEKQPIDSHANEILGALAEISVLLAGATPLANKWLTEFVPLYSRLLTPFGGTDGGYANGTAYAAIDMSETSVRHWDTLRRTLNLDMTLKPWARNFGRYLTYFLPPGTPTGVFGDAAEQHSPQTWALVAKTYAARVQLPINLWYARQWFQEDQTSLDMILAPLLLNETASFPENTPNAAYFPSIGWVAMHSDLRDRGGRTSVYFKSSPFGAASHAHYDQNSFTVNAQGKPLLIDSGYYDYFGSRHHFGWNIRTKAHNAITMDGGIGQEDESLLGRDRNAVGKITQFTTDGLYDMAVGDSSISYKSLTQAKRAIVYDRANDWVLVIDQLASAKPRTWEWNLHAIERFHILEDGRVQVKNGDAKACIEFSSSTPTNFEQHNQFVYEPDRNVGAPRPAQWHGKYQTVSTTTQFSSLALVSIACKPTPKLTVTYDKGAMVMEVGSLRIHLDKGILTREGS